MFEKRRDRLGRGKRLTRYEPGRGTVFEIPPTDVRKRHDMSGRGKGLTGYEPG